MAIEVYEKGSDGYTRLQAAADVIQVFSGHPTYVKDVYFDFGADWVWTTIVTERADDSSDSYQMLDPVQQEKLTTGDIEEYTETVRELVEKHLFKRKEDRQW